MPRIRSFVPLAVLFTLAAAAPAAALDLVYVVRHAQKNPSDRWSATGVQRPLTQKGAICAGMIGRTLENRGIVAVYTSETVRTFATGLAVSKKRRDIEIFVDDATLRPTPEVVEELRQKHAGDKAILIVGHSNTVDDVVLAFRPDAKQCLKRYRLAKPGIPETQYGDIWRLDLNAEPVNCRGFNRQHLPKVGEIDCGTP